MSDTHIAGTPCHACGTVLRAGAIFCRACGTRQVASETTAENSATTNPEARQKIGDGLAAASDKGRRHPHNQDAFWVSGPGAGGPGSMAIICDGISNSQSPHLASTTAAARGGEAMLKGLSWVDLVAQTAQAVALLPKDDGSELPPPSTTFAGVRVQTSMTAGMSEASWAWVGDTRIYWLPADARQPARLLTQCHVGDGGALSRCLGRGADNTPGTGRATLPRGGRLLVCTDGLWNYDPSMLVCSLRASMHSSAMDACDALIAYALSCGGKDNVSMALVRL